MSNAVRSEFSVANAYRYDRRSAVRWLIAHVMRYKWFFIATLLLYIGTYAAYTASEALIGQAIGAVIAPESLALLPTIALSVLGLKLADSILSLIGILSIETIAQRLEVDAREELYVNLLGKSQTFHNQQRVGDIMARATEDVQQLNGMINPGVAITLETAIGIAVPLIFIAALRLELLLVPLVFIALYVVAVVRYVRRLNPMVRRQREQFGKMNANLEETISGIEVVKASAQEAFERRKFRLAASLFRDYFVRQGYIEARYLPVLLFGIAFGLAFIHGMLLYQQGALSLGDVIALMGIMGVLRWPTFASIFSIALVQAGVEGARRIVNILNTETELDQNSGGYNQPIRGQVTFENVSFGYGRTHTLHNISFTVQPGQTVAIVGQTGSGKSTLTQLINRTYDVTHGRVLIDGVDVRQWDLNALRSQIGKIEQDVFLFSRSIAENIAFGVPNATQEQIEQAARMAQAHEFIMSFKDGYRTLVGERGVTLSGGQRQRIALARAFLSNPRILILDDSTSAIDSATEDQIQKAIRQVQQGRTTFLITHRLSQIRWADVILVLDAGALVASGTHDELLRRSPHYRRIFARYDIALPPLETSAAD
ncbi:MAG: ABC transporter ATP-binding protein [Candidatus Thermofonsia Clade 1 bacterium]|jgi:ATP-binding cassette subfamily B protein|uniref:ABC transporter ATP-binding protein n=1 Tax=Candidatus Thermofonsia Clade 1 bacterium TaxID=2364210 RepID=A0A2M8PEC8_9CHLR|nr:MAG: ABC transporter ATP-binding protein [Candidatus Thermofonsia Clade 1 bacterium]